MADGIQSSIIGLDGVLSKLESIKGLSYKDGQSALRQAALVVFNAAKSNAEAIDDPASEERIADNMAIRFSSKRFQQTGDLMYRIGIMGGAGGNKETEFYAGNPGGDTRHWRQLEFGNEHMPAQPFMRRALSENVGEVIGTFVDAADKKIINAIRRAERAAKKAQA